MITSPITRTFLVRLIEELELSNCCPILLRNYEHFPLEIGNDLDVFVLPEKLASAYSILASCASAQDGSIVHIHRRGYFIAVWLRFPDCEYPVHIDLYHGALTWHGLPILSDCELVNESLLVGTVEKYRIPRPSHEALISLLASILWGGFFKARYHRHITNLLISKEQMLDFREQLSNQFGNCGGILADSIVRHETSELISQSFCKKMRRNLFIRSILKRPLRSLWKWINHWFNEASCYLTRLPGMVIEYDHSVWNDEIETELRVLVSPFFGDVHVTRRCHTTLLKLFNIWRLRGKNHLVMIQGSRFAINGDACIQDDLPFSPSPSLFAKLVTSVLKSRISLQYHQR